MGCGASTGSVSEAMKLHSKIRWFSGDDSKDEKEDDHLQKVEEVLKRLENKGFRANLRKSFLCNKKLNTLVIC